MRLLLVDLYESEFVCTVYTLSIPLVHRNYVRSFAQFVWLADQVLEHVV